jgi:hypothetical protein
MNNKIKRKTFIFILIIIIFIFVICVYGVSVYFHINSQQPNVFLSPEYTQYKYDTESATFIWDNQTDIYINYNPGDWHIEKWNGVYWGKVNCEPWFSWLPFNGVQANSKLEREYNIGWFRDHSANGALKPGKYRLSTKYFFDTISYNLPVKYYRVDAVFEITE